MTGRTSMVIGRAGGEDDVDVNLEDCAFSGFIDFQHCDRFLPSLKNLPQFII